MTQVLSSEQTRALIAALAEGHKRVAAIYPGDRLDRQPVHTVYGGGHLFTHDTAAKLGAAARRALDEHGADPDVFAAAIGLEGDAALRRTVHERVRAKLASEPVEDYRIDFEDGYGNRPDAEEDAHVSAAAAEVAKGHGAGSLPAGIGIRIKPLTEELAPRALRTLDRFVTTMVRGTGGALPAGFVVTLPKITSVDQVAVFSDALDHLERALGLDPRAIPVELMVETPQSLFDWNGDLVLPDLVTAGRGRVRGAHFGTYDYTAACGITARWQRMQHPACDFARAIMQVCLAGTGVTLSDGATTVMPVGPHRAAAPAALTSAQAAENRAAVHAAWRAHYADVRSSLRHAYYQGWDLHPGQLATRYAAVFAFFLEGRDEAAARLRAFMAKAAQATLLGSVFDDAATGQGLLNYFLRGLACGALTGEEALATGLTLDELRSRSFVKILAARRGAAAR